MVYANIVFGVIMCILNHSAIRRTIGYRQELKKTVLIPTISAIVMGVCAFASYQMFYMVSKSNLLCTLLAIMIAVAVYGVLLIKLKCMTAEEMKQMPGGTRLLGICRKLRLM